MSGALKSRSYYTDLTKEDLERIEEQESVEKMVEASLTIRPPISQFGTIFARGHE